MDSSFGCSWPDWAPGPSDTPSLPTTLKTTCVVYNGQSKCHKIHNLQTKLFCRVGALQTCWLWFGLSEFGNSLGLGVYPSCPSPGSPWGTVSARGPRCAPFSLHGGGEQCTGCEVQVSSAKLLFFIRSSRFVLREGSICPFMCVLPEKQQKSGANARPGLPSPSCACLTE